MKIQAVLTKRPHRFGSPVQIKKSRAAILRGVVMGVGAVLGLVMFVMFRGSFLTPLWETYVAFRTDTDHKTFLEVLSGFVLQSLLLWGVLALFGSSAVGTWLLHPAVLLKCAGSAALAAFFLTCFGTGGVGYYFLTVFPGKLFFMSRC